MVRLPFLSGSCVTCPRGGYVAMKAVIWGGVYLEESITRVSDCVNRTREGFLFLFPLGFVTNNPRRTRNLVLEIQFSLFKNNFD